MARPEIKNASENKRWEIDAKIDVKRKIASNHFMKSRSKIDSSKCYLTMRRAPDTSAWKSSDHFTHSIRLNQCESLAQYIYKPAMIISSCDNTMPILTLGKSRFTS